MEASELYSLSISPLVNNPFALEWSQDNHVSLLTQQGVHIFELVPQPTCIYPTFRFWRTFIYPSEFLPAEPFQKLASGSLCRMEREEILTLLMQPAVTPKVDERTDLVPRIVKVAWSPLKMVDSSKCLLAILSSAGGVEILYKLGSSWLSVWNLSSIWYETIKRESGFDPERAKPRDFEKIAWPELIERLLCTAIAWSPLFRDPDDDSTFAYLVSVFRSSDLVVYRVDRVSDLAKAREPTVVHRTELKSSAKVSELLWVSLEDQKYVVFVGYADGRIHGLRVDVCKGIFHAERVIKYHDHPDRIIPSSITFMRKIGERRIILVTKGCWLMALSIDNNGECLGTRQLRVGHSFITGLTTVSSDKVLVTTQSAKIYGATIGEKEEMTYESVKSDLKSRKVQYLGLARSANATILVNVTSPDAVHDHLMNREPSTLQLFGLLGEEWSPWGIINGRGDSKISLYEYWDCLESLRVRAARSSEPIEQLPKIPQELEGLSIDRLRVVMWLSVISRVLEKKQMLKGVGKIVGEISEARPLIFLLSASEHLRRLARKSKLSGEEKRCVSFLRMYLEIYAAGEEDEEEIGGNAIFWRVNEALSLTSHIDSIETEACDLCGEVISELPWTIDRCPAGHKLPRCSLTLLQTTSMEYRICPICGRIFHPSLDDEYNEIRCLYCDVPAQYDSRVIANHLGDYENRWKNLSKRPALLLETKSQENENHNVSNAPPTPTTTTTVERTKRRGMNPHTFAVIVNKDDDDSFITETWQEF